MGLIWNTGYHDLKVSARSLLKWIQSRMCSDIGVEITLQVLERFGSVRQENDLLVELHALLFQVLEQSVFWFRVVRLDESETLRSPVGGSDFPTITSKFVFLSFQLRTYAPSNSTKEVSS